LVILIAAWFIFGIYLGYKISYKIHERSAIKTIKEICENANVKQKKQMRKNLKLEK
jgi:preprotein translocase subunit SecG